MKSHFISTIKVLSAPADTPSLTAKDIYAPTITLKSPETKVRQQTKTIVTIICPFIKSHSPNAIMIERFCAKFKI